MKNLSDPSNKKDEYNQAVSISESFGILPDLSKNGEIEHVAINIIDPNPHQPRQYFDVQALEELAWSIKTRGLIQPILVQKKDDGRYEIVAGERRWRASKIAGFRRIKCIVQEIDKRNSIELAIIENIQRVNLNVIEEARGYRALIDKFFYKQEDLGKLLGKSRSYISNALRVLTLPLAIQEMVVHNLITTGHAKLLIGRKFSELIAHFFYEENLTVREAEILLKEIDILLNKNQNLSEQHLTSFMKERFIDIKNNHLINENNRNKETVKHQEHNNKLAAKENKHTPTIMHPKKTIFNKESNKEKEIMTLKESIKNKTNWKIDIKFSEEKKSGYIAVHYDSLKELDDICTKIMQMEND